MEDQNQTSVMAQPRNPNAPKPVGSDADISPNTQTTLDSIINKVKAQATGVTVQQPEPSRANISSQHTGEVPFPEPDEVEPISRAQEPRDSGTTSRDTTEVTARTEPSGHPDEIDKALEGSGGDTSDEGEDGEGAPDVYEDSEDAGDEEGLEAGEDEGTDDPKKESIRNLRKIVGDSKKELKASKERIASLEEEIEKFKSGEATPEKIQELEHQLTEAKKYQKIVDLKRSDEYQKKYVEPLQELNTELQEFTRVYGLDEATITKALNSSNPLEINKILSSRGVDSVGVIEAKQLITKMQGIHRQAKEAEKDPENSLDNLIAASKAEREAAKKEAVTKMVTESKSAWVDVAAEIEHKQKFPELIAQEGDTEYNEKFVYPLQKAAATEYGKLVKALAEHGLTDPPKEILQALARYVQYGTAASTVVQTRNELAERLEHYQKNGSRYSKIVRPSVGTTRNSNESKSQERIPLDSQLDGIINRVKAQR